MKVRFVLAALANRDSRGRWEIGEIYLRLIILNVPWSAIGKRARGNIVSNAALAELSSRLLLKRTAMNAAIATGTPYAGSARGRPLDLAQLGHYTQGNRALEREILELFLAQALTSLERLKHAATTADWIFAAHKLKGSGRAVGAWRLAHLAEAAESCRIAADQHARTRTLAEIEAATAEARTFIGEVLDQAA